jgi:hypothetical protein
MLMPHLDWREEVFFILRPPTEAALFCGLRNQSTRERRASTGTFIGYFATPNHPWFVRVSQRGKVAAG